MGLFARWLMTEETSAYERAFFLLCAKYPDPVCLRSPPGISRVENGVHQPLGFSHAPTVHILVFWRTPTWILEFHSRDSSLRCFAD